SARATSRVWGAISWPTAAGRRVMAREAGAKKARSQGRSAATSSTIRTKGGDSQRVGGSSQPPRNVRVARPKAAAARGPGLRARMRSAGASLVGLGRRLKRPGSIALKILLGCAALCAALALGRVLQQHLTTSKAFAIDKIEVTGLSRIERPELLAAAGIDLGRNVFERNPAEVKARLLKHPWIAEAE